MKSRTVPLDFRKSKTGNINLSATVGRNVSNTKEQLSSKEQLDLKVLGNEAINQAVILRSTG